MQIVPAQREFADQHIARRARMAAAARHREPEIKPAKFVMKPPLVSQIDPIKEALKRAMEIPLVPVERDILQICTPPAIVERFSMGQIMREVCEKHGVSEIDVRSARRQTKLVRARQEFMWRARMETTRSYPQIAGYCGGRDHTTGIAAVRKHQWRIDNGKL